MLQEIIGSKTRSAILRELFTEKAPEQSLRTLAKKGEVSVPMLAREAGRMHELDLLLRREDGGRVFFCANRKHPLFRVLCELVGETDDIPRKIGDVLNVPSVEMAFLFGSYAVGNMNAESDIDVCVIGTIGLRKTVELLGALVERVSREINPVVYTQKTFCVELEKRNNFVKGLLSTKKIFVRGAENEFEAMVRQRMAASAFDKHA